MYYRFKCEKCGVIEVSMKASEYKPLDKCTKCGLENPERIWELPSQNYSMGCNGFCGKNNHK